jgi:hypothetical protein
MASSLSKVHRCPKCNAGPFSREAGLALHVRNCFGSRVVPIKCPPPVVPGIAPAHVAVASTSEASSSESESEVEEGTGSMMAAFDFDREFAKATKSFNDGRGLSLKDTQTLLDMMNVANKNNAQLSYTTVDQYKCYVENLVLSADDGWCVKVLSVDKNDYPELGDISVSAPFHHRDIVKYLVSEFGNRKYKNHFTLRGYEDIQPSGKRVYSHPHTADAWLHLQSLIPPHAVLAALQMYSDKSLVNDKGLHAHPVKCTLLNIDYDIKIRSLNTATVAYLPILEKPFHLTNDSLWRLVKLAYISKALALLLEPLKVWGWKLTFV